MKKEKLKKEEKGAMFRLHTRIRHEQSEFIKKEAVRKAISDGEMHRIVIDYYMANHK
jgi:DNA replication initiation complex subunit (GINS family)